jgi:hypothetical protein
MHQLLRVLLLPLLPLDPPLPEFPSTAFQHRELKKNIALLLMPLPEAAASALGGGS